MIVLPCPECGRFPEVRWEWNSSGCGSGAYTFICRHRNIFKKPIGVRSYRNVKEDAFQEGLFMWNNFVEGYWEEKRKRVNDPVRDQLYESGKKVLEENENGQDL